MSIHKEMIDWLVERLESNGQYDVVFKNVHYSNCLGVGESDVLAVRSVDDGVWWHFYEVKSSNSNRNFRRAQKQFEKYALAHPKRMVKGIYVTPTKVRRMHKF